MREVPRPEVDLDAARTELCRRHVHRFAPTNPRTFAWWASLAAGDARGIWNSAAGELLEVDFDGTPGWIRRADEPRVRDSPPHRGVRLLVDPDLRLLGRDRDGRFIAPGKRILTPAADTFHPNGVLVDGRIVGAWGRKGGTVDVILTEQLTPPQYDALAAEAASFPIRGARLAAPIGGAAGVI